MIIIDLTCIVLFLKKDNVEHLYNKDFISKKKTTVSYNVKIQIDYY